MSAQQIITRPSDAANESRNYTFADLRAAVLADRGTTVAVRAALGILVAVAAVIVAAGVATQSVFAMVGGGVSVVLLAGVLVWLAAAPAEPASR
ncbi:hypothetical protein [Micropruina sp.]|uniref:hypothetical protein n=1 Tax=Micropruina sp. TaxID=2737536 RepID=UPI0039E4B486